MSRVQEKFVPIDVAEANRPTPSRSATAENAMIKFARAESATVLRLALSFVFFWFGGLKLSGTSPVTGLVAEALPFVPARVAVASAGVIEVVIGLGLLTRIAPRFTMTLFFALLLGTFSLFLSQPYLIFADGCPLCLTVTGEFIVKNVVLIAAGLTLVANRPLDPG